MSRGCVALIASALIAAAGGCGAQPKPPVTTTATAPATAADSPGIQQLDIDGHSVAFGVGASTQGPNGTGFGSQVATGLGLQENNLSKPGATIQESGVVTDGWGKVLLNQPRPAPAGELPLEALPRMALLFYGANDLAIYGPDLAIAREAYKAVIARHRAAAVYEAGAQNDPSIEPDGAWTALPAAPGEASGGSWLTSPGPGKLTIEVEKGLIEPGSTVDVGLVQRLDTSATYTISVDGKEQGQVEASGPLTSQTTAYIPGHAATPYVFRIEDLKPGAHTIEVAASKVQGEAGFDYWQIEPPEPEPVVLVDQYQLPPYPPGAPKPPIELASNAEILELNRMTDSLAEEFGPRVITVDTDSIINMSPDLLFIDRLHLGQKGHDAVAAAIIDAVRSSPFAGELPRR